MAEEYRLNEFLMGCVPGAFRRYEEALNSIETEFLSDRFYPVAHYIAERIQRTERRIADAQPSMVGPDDAGKMQAFDAIEKGIVVSQQIINRIKRRLVLRASDLKSNVLDPIIIINGRAGTFVFRGRPDKFHAPLDLLPTDFVGAVIDDAFRNITNRDRSLVALNVSVRRAGVEEWKHPPVVAAEPAPSADPDPIEASNDVKPLLRANAKRVHLEDWLKEQTDAVVMLGPKRLLSRIAADVPLWTKLNGECSEGPIKTALKHERLQRGLSNSKSKP